mgnify:CR=1 FL=1
MDLATLIGIIASLGLVSYSILSAEGAATFINVPSIVIVFGGTMGATLVCFPIKNVAGVLGVVKKAFLVKEVSAAEIIGRMEEMAKKARKEGLLSLQTAASDLTDEFYKTGIQLVVDGQEADTIESILNTEIDYIAARHEVGAEVLKAAGTYAPAFGMIGTIIGLIQMLQNMADPSSIGPAMAVALVTTFYGALLSNVVFLPLATKLQRRSAMEVEQKSLIVEGLLSIHAGDNPRILVQKLNGFVAPDQRLAEAA